MLNPFYRIEIKGMLSSHNAIFINEYDNVLMYKVDDFTWRGIELELYKYGDKIDYTREKDILLVQFNA